MNYLEHCAARTEVVRRLCGITVPPASAWIPAVDAAFYAGISPRWILAAGPTVGPNGIEQAAAAANARRLRDAGVEE